MEKKPDKLFGSSPSIDRITIGHFVEEQPSKHSGTLTMERNHDKHSGTPPGTNCATIGPLEIETKPS